MLPTTHGIFASLASNATLTIDSVSGSTASSVLVSESVLQSTSNSIQPNWTATDFTPDQFSWSFIDAGSDPDLVSRSFDDPTISNPTITVTGSADRPQSSITHEIELVATETSSGIQRTATFQFQTTHLVGLGITTSAEAISRTTGTQGTFQVADAPMSVSLVADVANELTNQYGTYYFKYSDNSAFTSPPPRSRFNADGNTDWASATEPYITTSNNVEQLLEAEIKASDETYTRQREVIITDAGGTPLTLNGYEIQDGPYDQNFPFGPV